MSDEHRHPSNGQSAPAATELLVSGMTCNNCARHVTDAIQAVPQVQSASVALEAGRATVRWKNNNPADVPAVISSIKQAGYAAKTVEAGAAHDHSQHRRSSWQINLWIGVLGTVPLMLGEWVFGLGDTPWFRWISLSIATVVQFVAGKPFYQGTWQQLRVNKANMDTLVALGSTTAYGFSAWILFTNRDWHLYFMEAAAIITLISLGHWIEARISERASSALKALLNLAPQTARRLGKSSTTETDVPVADLVIDDLVVLRPGDHVPVDGEVVEGDSAVNEAMLTGESVPVDKATGSMLYAGTVNLNGRLVMRVTATGEATALAHIIAAVQRAQTSRANIQRLADKVSSIFVPAVIALAVLTQFWWGFYPTQAYQVFHWLAPYLWAAHVPDEFMAAALMCATGVLIIACPCAMGLATPTAIMAAANSAARRGILIRDGVALEKAGNVTSIIFDKTGTLTAGKPEVAKTWAADGTVALPIAAALAQHSTHPLSQALAKADAGNVTLENWQEVRGAGVEGRAKLTDGGWKMARLGSLKWLKENGVDLTAGEAFINEWSAQGATILGLALDKSLAGLFAMKDALKPGAAQVVEKLQRQGLKVYLLTGDNTRTAASIAQQTGIAPENVFAEVRPEQKAEMVSKLQVRGERVAFVGDGINDAPALEQADLGVAVARASDVARAAADVILLKSDIEAVPEVLGLARATLRTIKQNLFWAFFYNVIGIPLAALGFMSPILCAAAMGLSDIIVIGNALRLNRWRA